MRKLCMSLCLLASSLLTATIAESSVVTDGFTFAVADAFGGPSGVGTHFHSSTGGVFGNPAGLAEVGGLAGTEEVRGLSEYDLAGLVAGSAFVTFDVFSLDGLFGQAPYVGDIAIIAYSGNNGENLSDFQAPSIGSIATFNTSGLSVGDVLSFDISSIFNGALGVETSLGIRLQATPIDRSDAITFNDFRLTSTDESTSPPGAIPEPISWVVWSLLSLVGTCLLSPARSRV